jgi:hypothetical protein
VGRRFVCATWVRLRCSRSSGYFVEVITIDLRDLQRAMRDPDTVFDHEERALRLVSAL